MNRFGIRQFYLIIIMPIISFANLNLTLPQYIEKVKKRNLNINIALKEMKISYSRLKKLNSNLKARKKPNIEFGSEYQKQHKGITTLNTLKNSITLSYNLSYLVKQNNLSQIFITKAKRLKRDIVIASLVYQAKTYYYNFMRLKQEIKAMYKNELLLRHFRLITIKLIDAQLKLKSDLYKVENEINMVKNKILSKKNSLILQKYSLMSLMYAKITDNENFLDIKYYKANTPLSTLSNIEKNSPQIKSLELQFKAASSKNKAINTTLYPTLYSSLEQQNDWPNSGKAQYNFIVGIKIPLFGNDTTKYDNQIIKLQANKKKLELIKIKEEIKFEIKKLLKEIKFNKQFYKSYKDTYAHQEKTLKMLKIEYESGLISNIAEIVNMQKDMLSTKLKMIEIFYDNKIILAKLQYYNGDKI